MGLQTEVLKYVDFTYCNVLSSKVFMTMLIYVK
jgi:hypothetical protein